MYYRDMDIGCIVYAINDKTTFEAIEGWFNGIMNEVPNRPKIYIIGNKRDLVTKREVFAEMGMELAKNLGAEFYEVSALAEPKEIIELFEQMALKASEEAVEVPKPEMAMVEKIKAEEKGCC
jgi:GTPase SAR1 family protein